MSEFALLWEGRCASGTGPDESGCDAGGRAMSMAGPAWRLGAVLCGDGSWGRAMQILRI